MCAYRKRWTELKSGEKNEIDTDQLGFPTGSNVHRHPHPSFAELLEIPCLRVRPPRKWRMRKDSYVRLLAPHRGPLILIVISTAVDAHAIVRRR